MKIHPDRVLDHLRGAGLRIGGLLALRLHPLLHVLLAEDLHAERLEDLEVSVGLDCVDDVGREDLIEFLVRDVAAVGLAAALDVVDDVVELGLAQNRHALHRRQHGLDGQVVIGIETRHRRGRGRELRVVSDIGTFARMRVFLTLDLGHELVRVQRLRFDFCLVRRQIVAFGLLFATLPGLGADSRCLCCQFFRLRRLLLSPLRSLYNSLYNSLFCFRHIAPVYNSPTRTLSSDGPL